MTMRVTLSIDDDVFEEARKVACRLGLPFLTVVNEAFRLGLVEMERPARLHRYQTTPRDMGLRSGFSVDNVQKLLAQMEEEDCP
jgi:hypothetical protein